jgi:phosphopantothenoylcysteine decarboxylase/phosphopantothenate--cysteine ligase
MWENAATQANVALLRARGIDVLEPAEGALTSGDVGKGRIPDTATIIERFTSTTLVPQDLAGKNILVSAGGTREAIDPVRFIGNRSTGIQGIAIAEAARARGANVTLVIANSAIPTHPAIDRIDTESVAEMKRELQSRFTACDALFMAAAISDARPATVATEKIKKADYREIQLVENDDVLASLTANKSQQVIVAFAAETDSDSVQAAQSKMSRKGADVIYLNNVSGGAIFGSATTSGSLISSSGIIENFADVSKDSLATSLINHVVSRLNKLG